VAQPTHDAAVPDRAPSAAPRSQGAGAPGVDLALAASHTGMILALQRTAGNAAVSSMLRSLGRVEPKRRLARFPMPGYSQGPDDTCGAASMVSALLIWDLERADPSAPNASLVHACDLLLTETDARTDKIAVAARPVIQRIRTDAAKPGAVVSETDYRLLSGYLALMFNGRSGMRSEDISRLANAIGFRPSASGGGMTLSEVLDSDAVVKLAPGEVGQLNWIAQIPGRGNMGHAILLGRHNDGTWFVSDQGMSPPLEARGTRADIISVLLGPRSWLYGGNKADLQEQLPPVTQFVVLTRSQAFMNRGPGLIKPGEKLAEIDADWKTTGEVLVAWDYHSTHTSEADAKAAITKDKGAHGGVIVERPKDLFHIWKTNPLGTDKNLAETKIDADDSKEMALVKRRTAFLSVSLVLSDPSGAKRTPFAV
jgi:hypothetical protein